MSNFCKRLSVIACAVAACCVVAGAAHAAKDKEKPVKLKVGDKAPEFTSVDDKGKEWKSTDHVGKKILVVYFYPADLTGGCTKQACGFRDDMEKLNSKDVEVVGVSGDSAENHQLFKKVHMLNFTLLADEKGEVAKAFGVPLRKGGDFKFEFEGKEQVLTRGVTASRWTFVIDQDGKIVHKDTSVKAPKDSKTVMEVVAKLQKP
ncbi:Putative peroxiredoxin bcp [Symmachiella dynata]|uniref:thioredoxin-dependent peroxiredoxin n=1 Tax=Symmachiella dynata TaxID=2527995 RepID=A0A517ZVH3_9PLAN|nr:peroxiredoxin [Symmachiella dynata]QDU46470.1 Putative peroxiredoxin bcp [Symmachiella dynata]